MEVVSSAAIFAAIKSALGIAKDIKSLRTDQEVSDVRIALTDSILDLQERAAELHDALNAARDRIAELEQQIAEFDSWQEEKGRYTLKQLGRDAYAYVEAPPTDGGQAAEALLCAHCYGDRKRSILQFQGTDLAGSVLLCPRCKNRVVYKDRIREEEARARAHSIQRLSRP